jgi:hypothetical protein
MEIEGYDPNQTYTVYYPEYVRELKGYVVAFQTRRGVGILETGRIEGKTYQHPFQARYAADQMMAKQK